MRRIRAGYPEMFERCRETFACFLHTPDPRGTFEVTPEEREAFFEKLYAERGFGIWQGNFRDILDRSRRPTRLISDFVARKIRQRVKDQAVAEKLIPKNHGFGTRRVPLETKYYEVYNQPNVRLVDINGNADRAHHAHGHQDQRRRVRIRHHHLRHGLRRHHRQLRSHRHPRRWAACRLKDKWTGRAADLSRRAGRGLPQHDDADGPAHRAGQHSAQHRIQRRLGDRPDPLHARAQAHAASRPRPRGVAVVDRSRQVAGRGPAVQRGRFVDDRHQHATSKASRPASSPATAAARRPIARAATRWRRTAIGSSCWGSHWTAGLQARS